MRASAFAVAAMSLGATLAAGAIGLTWHHERDQADAVRELTQEVAALRAQLAAGGSTACTSAAAPEAALPAVVPTAVAAAPSVAPAGPRGPVGAVVAVPAAASVVIPPVPPIEPRFGDGGRPMSAAQSAALASATDLVDAALRRGTISRSEMAILRARIDAAGHSEESDALRAEIADAIDQGAVVAERAPAAWH
jgi:hypothetical protein